MPVEPTASSATPELPAFSWEEFLLTVPPITPAKINDLIVSVYEAPVKIRTPDLLMHCSSDVCRGERVFSCDGQPTMSSGSFQLRFITYSCRNCRERSKTFALNLFRESGAEEGIAIKIGEWPPFGPPTPPRLISLIGPDRDRFLRGQRAENQGLGIGAFAYYRRVVEDQRARLLDEIIRVSRKVGAKPAAITALEAAKSETQFSKSVEIAKDAIPESLLIDGHNPLLLLHRALSRGLHAQSDEECLALARSIRVVLVELAERLGAVLKDDAELKDALSKLLQEPDRLPKGDS